MMTNELPETMRAAQGSDYGDIDTTISVSDQVDVPRLQDLPNEKQRKTNMVIRTLAVALAPGDCRVLSGQTRELQGPPSFPYVPGGDCCGIVVELPQTTDDAALPFKVGDRVVAGFAEGPRGALGEYAMVSSVTADKVPESLSAVDAAALVGASPAVFLADRIQEGERVLVMGAGGGVGSHFCQLLRLRGAALVVGVASTMTDNLLKPPISCDQVIDYTKTDPLAEEKFLQDKFDVIVDLAGGGYARLEERAAQNEPLVVKSAVDGGRFITTVPTAGPTYEIHSWGAVIKLFLLSGLWKAAISRTWNRKKLPAYTFALAIPMERARATRPMELAAANKIQAVTDPAGPFPFTTEGVRAAFRKQQSRHAHGKVVISVAEK